MSDKLHPPKVGEHRYRGGRPAANRCTPITNAYRAELPYQQTEWMQLLLGSHERLERKEAELMGILIDLEKWWQAHSPDSMPTIRAVVRAQIAKVCGPLPQRERKND